MVSRRELKQEIETLKYQLQKAHEDLNKIKELKTAVNILKNENTSLTRTLAELRSVNTCLSQTITSLTQLSSSTTTMGMSDAKQLQG